MFKQWLSLGHINKFVQSILFPSNESQSMVLENGQVPLIKLQFHTPDVLSQSDPSSRLLTFLMSHHYNDPSTYGGHGM